MCGVNMNGKCKGSTFERNVAKILTKWVSGKEKPYIFWRSPSSGSLATLSAAEDVSGDIIAIREEGKFFTKVFSIETKDGYPEADFWKYFKTVKNNEIDDFWKQCQGDAQKAGKKGMLIFHKKRQNILVAIDIGMVSFLERFVTLPNGLALYNSRTPSPMFFEMEKFFTIVKPEHIKEWINEAGRIHI